MAKGKLSVKRKSREEKGFSLADLVHFLTYFKLFIKTVHTFATVKAHNEGNSKSWIFSLRFFVFRLLKNVRRTFHLCNLCVSSPVSVFTPSLFGSLLSFISITIITFCSFSFAFLQQQTGESLKIYIFFSLFVLL